MVARARSRPVAGSAHSSVCEPPIQTVPPLKLGTESRPAPAPWLTRTMRVRSAFGANQTHSDMPTPTVPQTPPEVAIRFPPALPISAMADDPSCAPVAGAKGRSPEELGRAAGGGGEPPA